MRLMALFVGIALMSSDFACAQKASEANPAKNCEFLVFEASHPSASPFGLALVDHGVSAIIFELMTSAPDKVHELQIHPDVPAPTLESLFLELEVGIRAAFEIESAPDQEAEYLELSERALAAFHAGQNKTAQALLDELVVKVVEHEPHELTDGPSVFEIAEARQKCAAEQWAKQEAARAD